MTQFRSPKKFNIYIAVCVLFALAFLNLRLIAWMPSFFLPRKQGNEAGTGSELPRLASEYWPNELISSTSESLTKSTETSSQKKLTEPSASKVVLTVERPFVTKHVPLLAINMRSWLDPSSGFFPCNAEWVQSMGAQVNLVMVSSTSDAIDALKAELGENMLAKLRQHPCFTKVDMISAGVNDADYKDGDSSSSSSVVKQFLFAMDYVHSKMHSTHMFQMEPDVLPCRKNWLHPLVNLCTACLHRAPFWWMAGSITLKQEAVDNADFINGNALYNVGDEEFRKWLHDSLEGTSRPFDETLHWSLLSGRHLGPNDATQEDRWLWGRLLQARMLRSSFVVNYGSFRRYTQTATARLSPDIYFVHSKWPMDSVPELMASLQAYFQEL